MKIALSVYYIIYMQYTVAILWQIILYMQCTAYGR